MKNKNGFLLAEETLKIIISVISIGFLVYFLTSLYFANQGDKELEQAEASLEFLIKEINSLEEDDIREVTIFNPEDWILISWPYENENELPNYCSDLKWGSCLCITKDVNLAGQLWSILPFTDDVQEKFLDQSDKEGVCRENVQKFIIKKNSNEQQPIIIESPLLLKIKDKIISK